ncbi:MAG: Rrf2 family transcriptional regulator [Phycisphaerae bacterium]
MLTLTRKSDYALVAMSELARCAPGWVSARNLAETIHVPLPVLTNILHQLLHHGLVNSARGARGGYCIAKPPEQISLAELIEAVEGPVKLTLCCPVEVDCESEEPKCDLEKDCRIKAPLQRVHRSLQRFLRQVDLANIAFYQAPVSLGVLVGDNHGVGPAFQPVNRQAGKPIPQIES